MSNRNQRVQIARETLEILDRGYYHNLKGARVEIKKTLEEAIKNTVLYTPENLEIILLKDIFTQKTSSLNNNTAFEVRNETTLNAAKRLAVDEDNLDVLCLNFASAKNPGGGFKNGSQAQEESLARSSGLYPSIARQLKYYNANKRSGTNLYTDHIIYSPKIPVIRNDAGELLDACYLVSFITSPAVNAGAVKPKNRHKIQAVMKERIKKILSVCLLHKHSNLVHGAWGCGVFRNEPNEIAQLFHEQLVKNKIFNHAFKKVVFAVLDKTSGLKIIRPFQNKFKNKTIDDFA